ncbi:MAG: TIGR02253 family HAD-type hydrolase [Planctomycetota bacterium]
MTGGDGHIEQPAPTPASARPASQLRPPRRLRAIFFDVDDTLYSTSEFANEARRNAVDGMIRAGLRMQRDDALRELHEVISEFSSNYEYHFDKLLARIPAHYFEGLNPAILIAAAVVGYHETKHTSLYVFEDAIEVLKLLRPISGLCVGIITAGLRVKQAEKLWRLGVVPYIDPRAIFISDQLGVSKPNVKLYQRACADVGVRPNEAMYVGDNPPHDIDPPNAIGMISVHARRSGSHRHERSVTDPDYTIDNFWDLLDILRRDFLLGDNESVGAP